MDDVLDGAAPTGTPKAVGVDSPGFLAGGGEMGDLIRRHDWASNPLGAPESWPQSLKTAVRIMLTSRQPIWIGWGKELIYLYNDPYKSIIGGKHPWALGRPTKEVWREIWPDIEPMLTTAIAALPQGEGWTRAVTEPATATPTSVPTRRAKPRSYVREKSGRITITTLSGAQ